MDNDRYIQYFKSQLRMATQQIKDLKKRIVVLEKDKEIDKEIQSINIQQCFNKGRKRRH